MTPVTGGKLQGWFGERTSPEDDDMPTNWHSRFLFVSVMTLTAGCGGEATAPSEPTVESVVVSRSDLPLLLGENATLTAMALDGDGQEVPAKTTWSSSDSSVVSLFGGIASGVGVGNAVVTALIDAKTATVNISVKTVQFASVAGGGRHACALTMNGVAYCWGDNEHGQLGVPPEELSGRNNKFCDGLCAPSPVPVSGGRSYRSVFTGFLFTCALDQAGAAYCWGENGNGELGDGTFDPSNEPVRVAGGLTFTSLIGGSGSYHACGLTADGSAHCWGASDFGAFGIGLITNTVPAPVAGGVSFESVNGSEFITCGVTAAGTGHCWGDNYSGRMGNGTEYQQGGPVPMPISGNLTFAEVTPGPNHSCGVTTAGVGYCWGIGDYVGDGPTSVRLTPSPIAGGLLFTSVSPGWLMSCGLEVGGAAYCWGYNIHERLGAPSSDTCVFFFSRDPKPCAKTPVPVRGRILFASLKVANGFTCGLSVGRRVYCWGAGGHGRLGNSFHANESSPTLVLGQMTP